MKKHLKFGFTALAMGLVSAGIGASQAVAQSGATEGIKAINGIAVDPNGPGTSANGVLIATKYGLLRATPDGISTVIKGVNASVTGLATMPGNPKSLRLSGIDKDGKPVGLLESEDGGKNWSALPNAVAGDKISAAGLAISRLSPQRMVALGDGIRLSSDGGATWTPLSVTPDKTFSVALSSVDENRIFAATAGGLMVSNDAGKSWAKTYAGDAPATLVASLSGGRMVAFIYGVGLIEADESDLVWTLVSGGFEDRFLRNLVQDPAKPGLLYVTADTGAILLSRDGGRDWISFEGSDKFTPARVAQGRQLFQNNCQVCHGVNGIGESPGNPAAQDEFGFKAPALNNDMHTWHHSDASLSKTIHLGSPRNERMIAWKDQLSDADIDSIIVYLKSQWSIRSLACQGVRHMGCVAR